MRKIAIYVFRNDLRIHDNETFATTIKTYDTIYPVYDVGNINFKQIHHANFIIDALGDLNDSLGGKLRFISDISAKSEEIIYGSDTSLWSGASGKNKNEKEPIKPYVKFSAYFDYCLANFELKHIYRAPNLSKIKSYPYKSVKLSRKNIKYESTRRFIGTRDECFKVLKRFSFKKNNNCLSNYEGICNLTKNDLKKHGSFVGSYLSVGLVSPRELYNYVLAEFGIKSIEFEYIQRSLIWREFYNNLSSQKQLITNKWKPKTNRKIRFFSPIFSALIKKLKETGFLTNRERLYISTVIIHELGVPWKVGEKLFTKYLIDYDKVLNIGNWLWISGLEPYSQKEFKRINPKVQETKYFSDI